MTVVTDVQLYIGKLCIVYLIAEERSAQRKKYKPISAEMKATFAELCIF